MPCFWQQPHQRVSPGLQLHLSLSHVLIRSLLVSVGSHQCARGSHPSCGAASDASLTETQHSQALREQRCSFEAARQGPQKEAHEALAKPVCKAQGTMLGMSSHRVKKHAKQTSQNASNRLLDAAPHGFRGVGGPGDVASHVGIVVLDVITVGWDPDQEGAHSLAQSTDHLPCRCEDDKEALLGGREEGKIPLEHAASDVHDGARSPHDGKGEPSQPRAGATHHLVGFAEALGEVVAVGAPDEAVHRQQL
mmetsp:Transcript_24140/g.67130  ORF Transcript_24140/g.67130 Transcript_24140/m.67130 type:complete len:250 (-) Transcript_24140:2586-3335(-)